MQSHDKTNLDDLLILDKPSRSLLGYFLHRWFHRYLIGVNDALGSLFEEGMITSLSKSTGVGRRLLFDFRPLDIEALKYLVGMYLYVYLCHKSANRRLMHRFEGKQVLLLRGYDFESVVSAGGESAMGMPSTDTQMFGYTLRDLLEGDVALFKVESPMDLYWETIDAQRYFDGEYRGMLRLVGQRPASMYLNALCWQEGVARLLDRMDHYVVYVSSITESVMWELEQLDNQGRRERVTVIFDEKAIAAKKAGHANRSTS